MNIIETLVPFVIVASTSVGLTIAATRHLQEQTNYKERVECAKTQHRRLIQMNSTIGAIDYCAPAGYFRTLE
jgi:hypothetical protein